MDPTAALPSGRHDPPAEEPSGPRPDPGFSSHQSNGPANSYRRGELEVCEVELMAADRPFLKRSRSPQSRGRSSPSGRENVKMAREDGRSRLPPATFSPARSFESSMGSSPDGSWSLLLRVPVSVSFESYPPATEGSRVFHLGFPFCPAPIQLPMPQGCLSHFQILMCQDPYQKIGPHLHLVFISPLRPRRMLSRSSEGRNAFCPHRIPIEVQMPL